MIFSTLTRTLSLNLQGTPAMTKVDQFIPDSFLVPATLYRFDLF